MTQNTNTEEPGLARRARRLREDVARAADDLMRFEATGTSPDGRAAATLSGEGRLLALDLSALFEDFPAPDPDLVTQSVIEAVNAAADELDAARADRLGTLRSGLEDVLSGLRTPVAQRRS